MEKTREFVSVEPEATAALLSLGFRLLAVRNGERVQFALADDRDESAEAAALRFWNGELRIEPKGYAAHLRQLTGMIREVRARGARS
jgi:hypothetical protein